MEHTLYLEKAKDAVIKVNGLDGSVKVTRRPNLNELGEILKEHRQGTITFVDTFFARAKRDVTVSEAQLFYGGELVSCRSFPDIYMLKGNGLELEFSLQITCSKKGVFRIQ